MGHREGSNGRRRLSRAAAFLVGVGLIAALVVGAAVAGYRYDKATADQILPGVRIAGVSVGGMTKAQAELALAPKVDAMLGRPIEVTAGLHSWVVTPRTLGTRVDVQAAVARAFALSSSFGWPDRVYRRVFGRPVGRAIPLSSAQDERAVSRFVDKVAAEVRSDPRNASIEFIGGKVFIRRSRPGIALKKAAATSAVLDALRSGRASVPLPVNKIKAKPTDEAVGTFILIVQSQFRLYLYHGLTLVRSYPVAVGLPSWPTPNGHFEVITKEINPSWINPARDTWGKDAPAEIAPGPGNPLGTRALATSAPGILIHGTPDDASIGTRASHGCVRMHMSDVEDLFPRVQIGTPVIIVS